MVKHWFWAPGDAGSNPVFPTNGDIKWIHQKPILRCVIVLKLGI